MFAPNVPLVEYYLHRHLRLVLWHCPNPHLRCWYSQKIHLPRLLLTFVSPSIKVMLLLSHPANIRIHDAVTGGRSGRHFLLLSLVCVRMFLSSSSEVLSFPLFLLSSIWTRRPYLLWFSLNRVVTICLFLLFYVNLIDVACLVFLAYLFINWYMRMLFSRDIFGSVLLDDGGLYSTLPVWATRGTK